MEIYKDDGKSLDAKKICFLIWEKRGDSQVVTKLTEILRKSIDEKAIFDGIEFFIPQLAHMSIHLTETAVLAALDRLNVIICLTSPHLALQLSFIYMAALEDFQLEDSHGKRNPNGHTGRYQRCCQLLQNTERTFIYGGVSNTSDNNNALEVSGSALALASEEDALQHVDCLLQGPLLYKRIERKSLFHSKRWKTRYFRIANRNLLCYHDEQYTELLRALPLHECTVHMKTAPVDVAEDVLQTTPISLLTNTDLKYDHYFEITNNKMGEFEQKFMLRANSASQFAEWTKALMCESVIPTTHATDYYNRRSSVIYRQVDPSAAKKEEDLLTPQQEKRYQFFRNQKLFIRNLTDICDELRYVEQSQRKTMLTLALNKLVIPPFCYLPLCKSTDTWRYILQATPSECHAFTTKARVPALMIFEVEQHPDQLDVATFLAMELNDYVTAGSGGSGSDIDDGSNGNSGGGVDSVDTAADGSVRSLSPASTRRHSLMRAVSPLSAINHVNPLSGGSPQDHETISSASASASASASPSADAETRPVSRRLSVFKATTADTDADAVAIDAVNAASNTDDNDSKSNNADGGIEQGAGGGESFKAKAARVRASSTVGHLPNWHLDGVIAKSNDDVRQEVFIMQLISYYSELFKEHNIPVWLHPYRIMNASKTTGLIQLVPNSISIDGLKKLDDYQGSMKSHFQKIYQYKSPVAVPTGQHPHQQYYPENTSIRYITAVDNYIRSMAGYSIVTYLLAIKDRHNGNIMVDAAGHIIHIDFGFVFGLAPGKFACMHVCLCLCMCVY